MNAKTMRPGLDRKRLMLAHRLALLVPAMVMGWYLCKAVVFGDDSIGAAGDWSLCLAGAATLYPLTMLVLLVVMSFVRPPAQTWVTLSRRASNTVAISGVAFLVMGYRHFTFGQWLTSLGLIAGWFALEQLTRFAGPALSPGRSIENSSRFDPGVRRGFDSEF